MGPDITNNESGKSPYAFSNLKQTTILNIFEVVIMMRMAFKFYAIVMNKLIRAY